MTWQFIIHGAKGLMYWNYAGAYTIHFQPDIWADFLKTIGEINELMRVVLADDVALDLDVQSTFPESFDYLVKQLGQTTWVFTVSTLEHGLDVSLDLSSLGTDLCVVDYTEGEAFTPDETGRVNLSYDANQVRILQIYE